MKIIYTLICFFILANTAIAQTKFEKESRLDNQDVPEVAKAFVYKLTASKKIKWYKEESQQGESIEAKTCYQNKKYSIEFDTDGTLQDIEIETKLKDIDTKIKAQIIAYLESTFNKFKIKKIQIQYSGTTQDLLAYFKAEDHQNITIKYEIVLKGKNNLGKHLYEFTFLEDGTFESSKKIVFRNTDNIEF